MIWDTALCDGVTVGHDRTACDVYDIDIHISADAILILSKQAIDEAVAAPHGCITGHE